MGNLAIAVTKFTAAAFTGSAAMISEGMHPLVDTGNCLLLLCGCLQEQQAARHGTSLRPWTRDLFLDADRRDHDLRRRRRFRYEGILHALHPRPITNITWNYAVQCLAAAFESMFLSHYANSRRSRDHIRYGRRYTQARTLRSSRPSSDCWRPSLASISPLPEQPYLDAAASMLIGLILTTVAAVLAYESKRPAA